MAKKWYESKTLWVNGLAVVGGILLAVSDQLALGGTLGLAGLVNLVLRVVTTQGVTLFGGERGIQ